MSDTRLRELERRWRETGAVTDEAGYLTERMRRGELSFQQLEIAALCDHPAAVIAYGRKQSLDAPFYVLLPRLGREPMVRAALSCAAFALEHLQTEHPDVAIHARCILMLAIQHVLTPPAGREALEDWLDLRQYTPEAPEGSTVDVIRNNRRAQSIMAAIECILRDSTSFDAATRDFFNAHDLLVPSGNRLDSRISVDLIAWALGNDPLPALHEQLESDFWD